MGQASQPVAVTKRDAKASVEGGKETTLHFDRSQLPLCVQAGDFKVRISNGTGRVLSGEKAMREQLKTLVILVENLKGELHLLKHNMGIVHLVSKKQQGPNSHLRNILISIEELTRSYGPESLSKDPSSIPPSDCR